MGFDKVSDIAVIFLLVALPLVTIGYGIFALNDQGVDVDTSFYTQLHTDIGSETGFKGATDSLSTGLQGEEGASEDPSEEGIIVGSFNALLNIGQVWNLLAQVAGRLISVLGIPAVYWTLIIGTALVIIAVLVYELIFRR